MSDNTLEMGAATDAQALETENQAQAEKTYTQRELDAMMARMRSKYEKQYADLGDIDELRRLKTEAEKRQLEDAKKRGEFDKVMQELAAKKDAEIQKRDSVIKEYKVNTPLLDAAARYRSVNPDQVKALLAGSVRLNEEGEVEVVDGKGSVRYRDDGKPFGVDELVKEFLDANPHFVQAGAATTNTRSQVNPGALSTEFDLKKLDLSKPEHRKLYKEARAKGLI